MIRIKRAHLKAGTLVLAEVFGWGLGYAQDNLTQNIARSYFPLLVIGVIGWFAYVLWNLVALGYPRLRFQSLEATRFSLMLVVTFWLATIIGGVSFFLINGMNTMTLWLVLAMSTFSATAYNFALIVVPLLVTRAVAALTHKSKMGRSAPHRGSTDNPSI